MRVRKNTSATIRLQFPAVRVDRLRIRMLGSARTDNAFAHIAELGVSQAAGAPSRSLASSPFPASISDAGHDPNELRALIERLQDEQGSPGAIAVLEKRLLLIDGLQPFTQRLARIGETTEALRTSRAPLWAVAQRDAMARYRTWAHYWISHQQPDGQFGAGYEDDVASAVTRPPMTTPYLAPVRSLPTIVLTKWSVEGIPSAGSLDEIRDVDHIGLLEQLALVTILYRRATGDTQFDRHIGSWTRRIRDTLVDGVKSCVYIDRNRDALWLMDRPLTVGAFRESRCSVGAQLYLGWLVTGDEDYLARLGWNLSSCLTDKWGPFTYWFYDKAERRVTSNDHLAHKIQTTASALSLMYLGGPGPIEAVWPQLAVSWNRVDDTFCALVRRNGPGQRVVHCYSFAEGERRVTANAWELEPGRYTVQVAPVAPDGQGPPGASWETAVEVKTADGSRRPTALPFQLPARTLTELSVARMND